jgi:PAS domain S-box-containing protein
MAESPPPSPPPPVDPDVDAVLRDSALLWEAVWRTTGEFIVVVDTAGIIRFCNRVEEGFTFDQVVGHSFVQFTVPESSAALVATLREVLADGAMRSLETTVRRLDGGLSYFALRISPLHRAGRAVAALVCCENIRPLKDTEHALTRERNVLRRLLEIQERERQLVSYEIHDGLAQYLAGAMMHLQAAEHSRPSTVDSRDLRESLRLLREAVEESRRLVGGLRPPALDELGIVDAIDSLLADARIDVPRIVFHHDLPAARLAAHLETAIFRIVQESLSNVRRHAAANSVEVGVELLGVTGQERIHVFVRDDGTGFDLARVPEDRFGLEGIRQRARLLGGEAVIRSAPGQGTAVEVDFPMTWIATRNGPPGE